MRFIWYMQIRYKNRNPPLWKNTPELHPLYFAKSLYHYCLYRLREHAHLPSKKQGFSKPSSSIAKTAARAVCCSGWKRSEKSKTLRQGATVPNWWQVPPVMVIGESELPNWRITTAERKARGYMRFVRVCYPADIRQGKSNLNRLRFFFLL